MEHLRVFGCVAHMKVPPDNLKKLDSRSKIVVYLGKEPGSKAFRLYDPQTQTICVSRDVVFEERKGWSWKEEESSRMMLNKPFTVVTNKFLETSEINTADEEVSAQNFGEGHGGDSVNNTSGTSNVQTGNSSNAASISSTSSSNTSFSSSRTEEGVQRFRPLSDILANTEPVELDEDELYLMGVDEPDNYTQAAKGNEWKKAMQSEIDAVERNGTWELTELPQNRKPIDLKWIYKLKRDASRNIIKHKAIIVAKGYVQKQGVDFDEVFAPVTRIETIRILLALAAKETGRFITLM